MAKKRLQPREMGFEIEVELLPAAQEAFAQFPDVLLRHAMGAAQVTGERIATEARARVRRRTGATARGITVSPARNGMGVIVHTIRPDNPSLPSWIEYGTKKNGKVRMPARPFLHVSAQLEQGAHNRRMNDALKTAIAEVGLGG